MVASADSSTSNAGNRVSKPLMEKKRRARINKSLDQLKSLLESYYSSNIRKRKLEKADILELTVKHLKNLQKIQSCAAAASSDFSEYQLGFRGCLANVSQYLLMADNPSGGDRWMLSQLSTELRRSLGRGDASSTTDSGPGTVPAREDVRSFLPPAAGPEDRSAAKCKELERSSACKPHRVPEGDAQRTSGASGPAESPQETRSSSRTFHSATQGSDNTEVGVWRPW